MDDSTGKAIPGMAAGTPELSPGKRRLMLFLTEHTAQLLGTLRIYVQRMGLAQGKAVPGMALEVLQEVAVEALASVERFDPERQPMAWLLGIGVNIIKRKKAATAKHLRREVTFGRLAMLLPESCNEDELFELIAPFALEDPEQNVEANEQANLILALVSPEDQRVLRLAVLHDFERETLARELGVSPVTARVRLHRALNRLRTAWNELQRQQTQEENSATIERNIQWKSR